MNKQYFALKKGEKMKNKLIGKKVIVRTKLAGVHAGIVDDVDLDKIPSVMLKDAYRMWKFYTRESTGSISDIAANGLPEKKDHKIGVRLDTVTLVEPDGFEIAEMTDVAYQTLVDFVEK